MAAEELFGEVRSVDQNISLGDGRTIDDVKEMPVNRQHGEALAHGVGGGRFVAVNHGDGPFRVGTLDVRGRGGAHDVETEQEISRRVADAVGRLHRLAADRQV